LYNSNDNKKEWPPLLQHRLDFSQGEDAKVGEQKQYAENDEE
jgi:hypothetical protein